MRQKNKLTNEELFHFCEQFSILLHSGISCAEGLELMLDDSRTQRGKDFFQLLLTDFEQNGSFSQALENSGYFPESMTSYVNIGEETGCLDEVLKSLSEHYDQEIEISENIRSAITYPLIMLAMMGTVIIILLVKVLPVFQQVFRQMGLEMNHFSQKYAFLLGTNLQRTLKRRKCYQPLFCCFTYFDSYNHRRIFCPFLYRKRTLLSAPALRQITLHKGHSHFR